MRGADLARAPVRPHAQPHELALVLDRARLRGAHTARTASTVSRSRCAGRSAGAPSQSVRMRRVPVPRPSTKRPPDISSRSSAVTAVSSGERPNAQAIAVPSSMRSVCQRRGRERQRPGVVVELRRPDRVEAGLLGASRELDVLALGR